MLDIADAFDLLALCDDSAFGEPAGLFACSRQRPFAPTSKSSAHVDDIVAAFVRHASRMDCPSGMDPPPFSAGAKLARWRTEPLTLGAVIVLCAAESASRRGASWAECAVAAEQSVIRLVELLPDRKIVDVFTAGVLRGLGRHMYGRDLVSMPHSRRKTWPTMLASQNTRTPRTSYRSGIDSS